MCSFRSALLLLGLIVPIVPANGAAQTVVPNEVIEGMEIRRDRMQAIGTDPDGPLLSPLTSIARDSRGFYYVSGGYEPGAILIFDSRGAYLDRFGRAGRGPGEFSQPILQLHVGPGDSIAVFDGPRYTLLEPGAKAFVRLRILPFLPREASFTEHGRLVVVAPLDVSRERTALLHIISPEGEVEQSFVTPANYDPRRPYDEYRVLARAAGDRIWVGNVRRYEIQLWSISEARALHAFVREAPWYPEWLDEDEGTWAKPKLRSMVQDGQFLWTMIVIADPDLDVRSADLSRPLEDIDWNEEFDTVIEVIDLQAQRVVARSRFDEHLGAFLGGEPIVYVQRQGSLHQRILETYRLRVMNQENQ